MLEKNGEITEKNTPPEKKACCGGSCHPKPEELAQHLTKRAADVAAEKKTTSE